MSERIPDATLITVSHLTVNNVPVGIYEKSLISQLFAIVYYKNHGFAKSLINGLIKRSIYTPRAKMVVLVGLVLQKKNVGNTIG